MKTIVTLTLVVLLTACNLNAETITVAGVVQEGGDMNRRGGVSVRLCYRSDGKGVAAEDRTSEQGVYNVVFTGLIGNVSPENLQVWVVCNSDDYVGDPVEVRVEKAMAGHLVGKARDLLVSRKKKRYGANEARLVVQSQARSQELLTRLGIISKMQAEREVSRFVREVVALTPEFHSTNAMDSNLAKAYEEVTRGLGEKELIGSLASVDSFLRMGQTAEFRDAVKKSMSFSPSVFVKHGNEKFNSAAIDVLVDLPPQEIDPRLFDAKTTQALVKKFLERSGVKEGEREVKLIVPGIAPKALTIPAPDHKEPAAEYRRWLERSPEARKWLVYEKLLEEIPGDNQSRGKLEAALPRVRPEIITP